MPNLRVANRFLTLWYVVHCVCTWSSQQRRYNSKQYDYTKDETSMIYGLHEYRNFIGIDKL